MNELEGFLLHAPALIVAIPLLGAFLTPLVGKINDKLRNIWVLCVVAITSFFVFLLSYNILANDAQKIAPNLVHNGYQYYVFGSSGGPESVGSPIVRILFQVDGMNAMMIIIGAILAIAGIIYSLSFIKKETGLDKYFTLYLLIIAGMFGMMLTGDMFNFFVFLEITSIASCALIAFWTNKGKAVEAGFKYIVISSIGALFILFAIALLYSQYNALNMSVLSASIQYTFLDKIALVLLIGGLAMKAGIVPMHMWLPDAYGKAPSSVTVVLIGTTLASLYAMLRMTFTVYGPNLNGVIRQIGEGETAIQITLAPLLGIFIIVLALITILIGVLMAIKQSDFKRLIAYAAVAEIGYMILAIGAALTAIDTPHGYIALKGGIFHILNDALDVGLLFLVAGAVYYATKETSLNRLGGLARNMKYTTVFFVIGLFAVSGLPPMNGFASKLLIYQSTFQFNPILAIVAILCSILLLAVFVKIFHSAFLGPKQKKFEKVTEVPKTMLIAMAIVAGIIIFIGLFPDLVVTNIIEPAADALLRMVNMGGV
jgi:multicomponent Na+:H+ antiporter subunit D